MNRPLKQLALIGGLALLGANLSVAGTVTLTFEGLPPVQVGNQYAAEDVTFSLTDFGVVVDASSWGTVGDNGPYFDGFNGNPSYGTTLTFTDPVSDFSVDASRTNGSSPSDSLLVSAYDGASLLGSVDTGFGGHRYLVDFQLTLQWNHLSDHPGKRNQLSSLWYRQRPIHGGLGNAGTWRRAADPDRRPALLRAPIPPGLIPFGRPCGGQFGNTLRVFWPKCVRPLIAVPLSPLNARHGG